jgi:ligand-binding sensor protein
LGATASTPAERASRRAPRRAKPATFKARSGNGTTADRGLIESLNNSKVFHDYERAFTEATGLPVALRAVESWQLPHHGQRNESPFCALVLETSRACASCLQVQEKLAASAAQEPHTVSCPAGLCDTAVPVRLGDRLIGFLQTGQVFRKTPSQAQF